MKLVIGCGNTDRGDDGAGILVARQLRTLGLNAIEHCGDGPPLIELWHGFDSPGGCDDERRRAGERRNVGSGFQACVLGELALVEPLCSAPQKRSIWRE